jgi:hypothetical protein
MADVNRHTHIAQEPRLQPFKGSPQGLAHNDTGKAAAPIRPLLLI